MINESGLKLIKEFEGLYLKAYRCPAGVLTIGYGHTGKDVKSGMTITKERAEELLKKDIARFEKAVKRLKYDFNENQFSALVSFAFNCGEGNLKKLTQNGTRTKAEISKKLLLYNRANCNELKGLTRRRKAEQKLFNTAVKSNDYKVKVIANVLNVRDGAGTKYKINTTVKKNEVYTIVEKKDGWGKLKSGAGWICLKYVEVM